MIRTVKIKCEDCDGDGGFNGYPCTSCGGSGSLTILDVDDDEEETEIEKYWVNDYSKCALRVIANNIQGISFCFWDEAHPLGMNSDNSWWYKVAMGESALYRKVEEDEFISFIKKEIEKGIFDGQ